MKIAFHDNSMSLRGTTVALYDYAFFTRKYLGIESIILFNKNHPANSMDVYNKFKTEFDIFGYDDKSEIDNILSTNNCDYFFMEKGGKPDGVISGVCKNLVHAISLCNTNDIHGDIFAMGSRWLSEMTNWQIPYVPYISHLPDIDDNMRSELGIPNDALVFGRNGGWDTFDIQWVKEQIIESLKIRDDIWFIFQFTQPFVEHKRVIYLPGSSNLINKVRFINSCDVMIHARQVGESFGLSCAEFSLRNKPVITWSGSPERSHIDILGKKGLYYKNEEDLLKIILNINKQDFSNQDWNCYREFSPVKVIEIFEKIYLK